MTFWPSKNFDDAGAVVARTTQTFQQGMGVCTRIVLPDNYRGVAPTFYGLDADWPSYNTGKLGELDFEYLSGNSHSLELNVHFNGGGWSNVKRFEAEAKYGLTYCLANWGDTQQ
eukprot:TRINITY_DN847_c0_g1_i2.p1 TRINITY_DN847_c0_g1~~TRINITY_DN847_c0_g1_i2.p1  ORF type:complete len:114 (+),score=33.06 TRINITY_DN847_c0_g1_i2:347-688(+)